MALRTDRVRYQPVHCRLLGCQVWAIVTAAEGKRRIVNCLDKAAPCYGTGCAFTTDDGEWPYDIPVDLSVEQRSVP